MSGTSDLPTSPTTVGASVTVTEHGPYVVSGGLPLHRRRIVRSDAGEALTWETTAALDAEGDYALCRCGGSSNKPFCDGTHRTRDWTSDESAPTDGYDERAKTYPGTGVVVRDDRSICAHAGFCSSKVSNVWKMVKDTDAIDTRSNVIAMVERCPSGALTYRLEGGSADVEPELPAAVWVVDDGPLEVTGGVPVTRSDGQPLEVRNRMVLCRCGQSSTKPLCDGTHYEVEFTDHG